MVEDAKRDRMIFPRIRCLPVRQVMIILWFRHHHVSMPVIRIRRITIRMERAMMSALFPMIIIWFTFAGMLPVTVW